MHLRSVRVRYFLVAGDISDHGYRISVLSEGDLTIVQIYESINLYCAGINSTTTILGGI